MQKKIIALLGGALSLGLVTSASAADMAVKARPVVAPVLMYDWTGFYVGVNGGWGSSRKCWDFVTPAGAFIGAEGCHDATGGTVGGQIGYRWQASNWVFGVEAQGNWADFKGRNGSIFFANVFTNETKVRAFGLFTGQVGYAFNNALLYVKGGAAVADDRYNQYLTATGALIAVGSSDTRWGGVIGVGFEYGFTPNWSFAVEYDHAFMQDRTTTLTTVPGGLFFGNDRVRQDMDIVTGRINYKFGGPVVARY